MTASDDPFPGDPALLQRMLDWAGARISNGPDPRNGARTPDALFQAMGTTITPAGIGGQAAFDLFADVITPSTRPFDHPTSLSFVAAAPTPAALGFDAALGAAEIFAGNWEGGSGAVAAENQALGWLASLAGWPDTAGGCFVSGGTMGNLSALHAARTWRATQGPRPPRWRLVASGEAHSSITTAAAVMDVALTLVPPDNQGRMTRAALSAVMGPDVFAIVANGGATNCGAVDDLAGAADAAAQHGAWLHVDGAYGAAALADPATRGVFAGIERADSFIVDPHKWLFAPYDSCALVYRQPQFGAAAHGQRAAYLDAVNTGAWNPSDYAIHLTRRARGLPLWFSLATYGSDAYAAAIAQVLRHTTALADGIRATPNLELVIEPQLSVILFRRPGMARAEMETWAEIHRRSGDLLCLPTIWRGEDVFRLCLVNPATDSQHVLNVIRTLA